MMRAQLQTRRDITQTFHESTQTCHPPVPSASPLPLWLPCLRWQTATAATPVCVCVVCVCVCACAMCLDLLFASHLRTCTDKHTLNSLTHTFSSAVSLKFTATLRCCVSVRPGMGVFISCAANRHTILNLVHCFVHAGIELCKSASWDRCVHRLQSNRHTQVVSVMHTHKSTKQTHTRYKHTHTTTRLLRMRRPMM